jgi:hypothetical protein
MILPIIEVAVKEERAEYKGEEEYRASEKDTV